MFLTSKLHVKFAFLIEFKYEHEGFVSKHKNLARGDGEKNIKAMGLYNISNSRFSVRHVPGLTRTEG